MEYKIITFKAHDTVAFSDDCKSKRDFLDSINSIPNNIISIKATSCEADVGAVDDENKVPKLLSSLKRRKSPLGRKRTLTPNISVDKGEIMWTKDSSGNDLINIII